MKVAIIAPLALVVGIAGGVALAPSPPPPEIGADSLHATTPGAAPENSPSAPSQEHPETSTVAAAPAEAAPAEAAPHDSATPPKFDAKRMAAIFDKLPATDVPLLMAQFTDSEAVQVLRLMKLDQVTAVVAAMPKERSAQISRLLLAAGGR